MTNSLLVRSLSTERTRLRVTGKDARRFLHGMVTSDVQGLKPGQGCHAAMLTVKGKLLSDLGIHDCGDEGLLLELPASTGDKIRTALDAYLITDDAAITDASPELAELGVYGSGAAAALSQLGAGPDLAALPSYHSAVLSTAAGPLRVAATPELGVPGFLVFGAPAALAATHTALTAQGAQPLSEADATRLRVEAGRAVYGQDMDEDRMPSEAGLDDVFSPTKGCYLGQEVVVRLRDRGQLNRKLVGFRLPGGELPAAGTRLAHPSRANAGNLTTIVHSPRFGNIALGYAHRSVWEPGTELQLLSATGEPLGRSAVVAALPFRD
jgi:folate-binding protein YgfZ